MKRNSAVPGVIGLIILLPALLAASGCASLGDGPPPEPRVTAEAAGLRNAVVMNALTVMETPYRWGGEGPRGFDCSGLVHYAYDRAGLDVPRTTRGQYRRADWAPIDRLAPGDLVFFRIDHRVSHVGIYIGNERMVHAPSRGEAVRVERLDKDYWRSRYAGAASLIASR